MFNKLIIHAHTCTLVVQVPLKWAVAALVPVASTYQTSWQGKKVHSPVTAPCALAHAAPRLHRLAAPLTCILGCASQRSARLGSAPMLQHAADYGTMATGGRTGMLRQQPEAPSRCLAVIWLLAQAPHPHRAMPHVACLAQAHDCPFSISCSSSPFSLLHHCLQSPYNTDQRGKGQVEYSAPFGATNPHCNIKSPAMAAFPVPACYVAPLPPKGLPERNPPQTTQLFDYMPGCVAAAERAFSGLSPCCEPGCSLVLVACVHQWHQFGNSAAPACVWQTLCA